MSAQSPRRGPILPAEPITTERTRRMFAKELPTPAAHLTCWSTWTRRARPLLLIEGDVDLRAALDESLREEGYAVENVATIDEALAHIDSTPYQLILLDLSVTTRGTLLSSAELLRRCHPTPVGLLSAWQPAPDEVAGLGFAFVQAMPFDLDVFLNRIERSLNAFAR